MSNPIRPPTPFAIDGAVEPEEATAYRYEGGVVTPIYGSRYSGATMSARSVENAGVNVEVRRTTLTNTESPKGTKKADNTVMTDETRILRDADPRIVLTKIKHVPSVMVSIDGKEYGADSSGLLEAIFFKLPVADAGTDDQVALPITLGASSRKVKP